ncbi:MAG: hypothetical protein HZC54_05805 [Verrucomicrobia bacterium]|nr:hypothetical protein [Verrucomicrobiota bacterium]
MKQAPILALAVVLSATTLLAASPDIIVRTDVLFGNAANVRVQKVGPGTEVRFTPDPHGGPECLWFCFRVCRPHSRGGALGKLRLVLECPETMLGGGNPANFRPVFRPAGGDWDRTDAPELIELPDGRKQAAWTLDAAKPSLDFAFAFPYGRAELERMVKETGGYWRVDTIGVSQGGRPLLRLSNDYGKPKGDQPGLYLMSRQHSAEVSGGWVLDGVLRRFAELGDAAPLVWAVPLSNIDGVEQGDYGKDNFPYDVNRAWGNPPMRHETLVFQQDMRRWAKRCRPVAGCDFHAPGASEAEGIYAFIHKSEKYLDVAKQAKEWSDAAGEALGPEFAAKKFTRSGDYNSRWNTPRFGGFCQEEMKMPGIAFETPYAMIQKTVMTREKYQEAGRRIADALAARAKCATNKQPSQP